MRRAPRRPVAGAMAVAAALIAFGPVSSQDAAGPAGQGLLPQFSTWLRRHGVDDGRVRLVDEDEQGWGRGIVARKALKEGDLLFRIPLEWCLHSVAARRNRYLAKPLSQGILPRGMHGEAIMVALLLMVEACQTGDRASTCEMRQSSTSEWLPYIRVLPTNFSAPVFWSTSEFQELRGSQMEEMVASDLSDTRREWSMIQQKLVVPNRDVFCAECFNFDTYRWAAWNVHSRALTLKGIKYLIPLADMVNYQPLRDDGAHNRNHQDLFLKDHRISVSPQDEGKGTAEIFADRDFAPGSMIVESYGDNPNNMYLRYFGFVPASNPTDCRTLQFSLQQVKESRELKAAALQEARMPAQVKHCFRLGEPVPLHILRFLRVLHAKSHELGPAKNGNAELSARNERAVYKTIAAQCDKLLQAFPTSLEEDQQWLDEVQSSGSVGGEEVTVNKKNAVVARMSEKRILARLRRIAKQKAKEIKAREKTAQGAHGAKGGPGDEVVFSHDEL